MIDVTVVRKREEAKDICSFELAREDGEPLPAFSAGSHIDVHLPGGHVRQYSLFNHPEERHRYMIGVLLDPASRGGSKAMHEDVHEGTKLKISEPRNLFALEHGASRSILFAGGIGITPILCMAERLAQSGADFEMHYCSRAEERTAFVNRIKESLFAEKVHFHFDDGYTTQKLDIRKVIADAGSSRHLYVCGPGGFMEFVLSSARQAGWTDAQLHREYFAAAPTSKADDGSFEVKIASTGETVIVPAEKSVAEVLADVGIEIPLSCEQGICGTCLTRVLEGEPDHRDMFLTQAEHARNDQFTPCCSRAKSKVLVLDI